MEEAWPALSQGIKSRPIRTEIELIVAVYTPRPPVYLYLKGISTGDFTEALAAILGEKASGLSATNIVRLKVGWEADYKAWSQRELTMVFKLGLEAQKHWRRLNGSELLAKVVTGVKFVDGEEQIQEAA